MFDGFAGSGMTAIAALLCSKPTTSMLQEAAKRGVQPSWGARRAVVYELSGLGSFIGETLCLRPEPTKFVRAAQTVLCELEQRYGWLYSSQDPLGGAGTSRYFVWSEQLRCPECGEETSVWESCVRFDPVRFSELFKCSHCACERRLNEVPRVTERTFDEFLRVEATKKVRVLVRVDGLDRHRRNWSRIPESNDFALLERISNEPVPYGFPLVPLMHKGGENWGDLWRSGYHEGITHVHHFYTRRNLIALSALWQIIDEQPSALRAPLRLWASSYNSSHSTLMTRVVAKTDQRDLVLTSSQPGVLYISSLPVEKNVFIGLRRKLRTFAEAFKVLQNTSGQVEVRQGSSIRTDIDDQSVDYIFTDPPFGGNIPYSEVNFINEAWLGRFTAPEEEAVISASQGKGLDQYETLLEAAFREMHRVLKPRGQATVVFHSTQAAVWQALVNAYTRAGFAVKLATILDKSQGSFKQVTTRNSAKGDAILLLKPKNKIAASVEHDPINIIRKLVHISRTHEDAEERVAHRLYSRFVSYYVIRNASPPIGAEEFYRTLSEHLSIV